MDLRVRQNEFCIIGQPQCGYYFNSSRSCFIGYGFSTSKFEVLIVSKILTELGIEPVEAGESISSGQNVFCTKICSKIIQSRFCIVFVNNDIVDNQESPNPNVHSEYGLMLGFNKHIIPFQKIDQKLAFNIAGFDTVKYDQTNFETKARRSIEAAISATEPTNDQPDPFGVMKNYFVSEGMMYATLYQDSEKELFDISQLLGYSLLRDFSGINYTFLGIFNHLTIAEIKWRLRRTIDLKAGLIESIKQRKIFDLITEDQFSAAMHVFSTISAWLIVDSSIILDLEAFMDQELPQLPYRFISTEEVRKRIQDISDGAFYSQREH